MILYLDTSALIKLYVDEAGSDEVKIRVQDAQIVSTSRVAYVAARAGVARKHRVGALTEEEYRRILEDLEGDWENYFVIEVSEDVTQLGGDLVDKYPLRGFDAIHLASGLLLKRRTRLPVSFFCFDERLQGAALAEGLAIEGS